MLGKLAGHDWQEAPGLAPKGYRNDSPAGEPLTGLEKKILKLTADGKSSQEISKLLCLSVRTLYDHRIEIMDKLNFNHPDDLIKYCIDEGYTYKEI